MAGCVSKEKQLGNKLQSPAIHLLPDVIPHPHQPSLPLPRLSLYGQALFGWAQMEIEEMAEQAAKSLGMKGTDKD